MKRLAIVLAAVGLVSASMTGSAYAAKPKPAPAGPPVPTEAQIKKGMTDAPAVVTAAGLTCTVKNAWWQGQGTKTVDKKPVKYDLYEVACNEGVGYIVTKDLNAPGTTSFSCIKGKSAYDAAAEAQRATMTTCVLPENASVATQFQPTVAKTGMACTVKDVLWAGGSDTSRVDRYEFSCTDGTGYLFDVPYSGNPDKPPVPCIKAESAGYECKFTPKAARVALVGAMANRSDRPCTVGDARWVGTDPNNHNEYYEVACTGKPGYFLETSAAGAVVRTYDCVRAQSIGGGCKLTDMTTAKAGAAQSYNATLASNGVTCTPTDLRLIGKETRTGRDVVEFTCPERRSGLVAMIPTQGATGRFEAMDCFTSESRALPCKLTPRPQLMATLKGILTAVGKTCEPSEFKIVGPDEGDGDYVEVKCGASEEGYVIDLPPDRARTIKTMTCTQAARGINSCTIPGNK